MLIDHRRPNLSRSLTHLTALTTLLSATALCLSASQLVAQDARLELLPGDSVAVIGNTLADRMQHHGWLETYVQTLHPEHALSFRNLGFPGDEVKTRPRSASFGSPDEWLTKVEADVVFCFFGYNEALRGEAGLADFERDLAEMLQGMGQQKYNGKSPPRLVVFSPIAHEDLGIPYLPDGQANNQELARYTRAMEAVCQANGVLFVDLFAPTRDLYRRADAPLTMNGIHLLDHGNRALAEIIVADLFAANSPQPHSSPIVQRTRAAVLDKNLHWFSRYRVVDGFNVYGGRSKLNWHGQSNYDVLQREMEIFDVMTANRDPRIWAAAHGETRQVLDDNLPPLLEVKTNKPGELPDGKHPYLSPAESMQKMTLAEGMQVNVFASEEMFPELVNPVQMAVDTDGRLFASVWPSYPHWKPTEPRTDRIVCLPDEDGNGVADECIVFADELNSITGIEFWGGGLLVAAPPEIWFLKDTDGDDRADYKLRILQGVSSADTHHTANAMVIGTDGWLYWSRGIFHVTNMETPTKTFRSTSSGVYRFNPRTFEIEFHFPIGPNPHGDVIDQWGYQFVNDGTGGTGSYANIGKGIGNKQWFKKRVRPVAATGILSSSHFPEQHNGNFLICNTIGFLGVLQHEVHYNGADITAEEIEPILVSSDPNFRPTDLEIGGDGTLYVSDWCNVLIGHMQHNIRDPNRDHQHGRIYRVTYAGRPLLKPVKLKGQPIETVLQAFYAKENGTRYRARLELSGRATEDVTASVSRWTESLQPSKADDAQAMLECLWVFEEHRVPNRALLARLFGGAAEPRVRAAAIRTLGHWGGQVADWEPLLIAAARDESPLVRAEAVKAAVSFPGLTATEVIFEVANRPTDPELDTVLNYAKGQIHLDQVVQDSLNSGEKLSAAAYAYVLGNASVADLLKLDRTERVYQAILDRTNATAEELQLALAGLAQQSGTSEIRLLLDRLESADATPGSGNLKGLSELLSRRAGSELREVRQRLQRLAQEAQSSDVRQLGYAAWIVADGSANEAFAAAETSKQSLGEFLAAIPQISEDRIRSGLYPKVQALLFELPRHLASAGDGGQTAEAGVQVDYFQPNPKNVALETLAKKQPKASGVVPNFTLDIPQIQRREGFALRFSGGIRVDEAGEYTFFTSSDDGSRLYIGNELVVDNDGDHGMAEKSGKIYLEPGTHPILVTFYERSGSEGLAVSWSGPGSSEQAPIPNQRLTTTSGDTLHDAAIRSLAAIPGHETNKFLALGTLIQQGKHRAAAVRALLGVPAEHWSPGEVLPIAESLAAHVSEIPAKYRTGKPALEAMQLTDALASVLPEDQARLFQSRLAELRVNVIRIGTVPHRMIFDKERIVIQAGKPVEFVFSNTDQMPHNFSIVMPGALEEIGMLAEATARDPDAQARHYVPKSDKVLLASRLLQPGENQALSYQAPTTPGIYPFVCTYPGHWRRMYGALYVVEDLQQYLASPEAYLAEHPLPLRDELLKYNTRDTDWTFEELATSMQPLLSAHAPEGPVHDPRNFLVGKSVFKAASCVACHRLNGEGQQFGPDLAQLEPKKQHPEHILRSILDPDRDIDPKFQAYSFELDSGQVVKGLIVDENADEIKVIADPLASAEPTVVAKGSIEARDKLAASTMPKGLLNKLSREEILDLIAYVSARGNEKHKLFAGGHAHDH